MAVISTERMHGHVADMLWSQALRGSELALVVIDPSANRIVQFAEEALQRLTGIAAEEFASMPASDLFPDQLPELVVLTQACIAKGTDLGRSV